MQWRESECMVCLGHFLHAFGNMHLLLKPLVTFNKSTIVDQKESSESLYLEYLLHRNPFLKNDLQWSWTQFDLLRLWRTNAVLFCDLSNTLLLWLSFSFFNVEIAGIWCFKAELTINLSLMLVSFHVFVGQTWLSFGFYTYLWAQVCYEARWHSSILMQFDSIKTQIKNRFIRNKDVWTMICGFVVCPDLISLCLSSSLAGVKAHLWTKQVNSYLPKHKKVCSSASELWCTSIQFECHREKSRRESRQRKTTQKHGKRRILFCFINQIKLLLIMQLKVYQKNRNCCWTEKY